MPASANATPLLRCLVSYAGTTHSIETGPVADAYKVPSVDIGGRFRFKAVMAGTDTQVDYISLYTYLDTRRQPVLVQQAKYLPPYSFSIRPVLLTGEQHVFAGPVERELIYSCTLENTAP
jgi:hypothetical protein